MSEFAKYDPEPRERRLMNGGNGPVIRPARASDPGALAEMAAEREGEPVERWREIFARILVETESGTSLLLVATVREQILGYGKAAIFSPPEDAPANCAPQGWYLTGVVVRPADRRRGVGVALTQARLSFIAGMAPNVHYFANARNRATIALHRNLGFGEVTRDFWFPGVKFDDGIGILFRLDQSED